MNKSGLFLGLGVIGLGIAAFTANKRREKKETMKASKLITIPGAGNGMTRNEVDAWSQGKTDTVSVKKDAPAPEDVSAVKDEIIVDSAPAVVQGEVEIEDDGEYK